MSSLPPPKTSPQVLVDYGHFDASICYIQGYPSLRAHLLVLGRYEVKDQFQTLHGDDNARKLTGAALGSVWGAAEARFAAWSITTPHATKCLADALATVGRRHPRIKVFEAWETAVLLMPTNIKSAKRAEDKHWTWVAKDWLADWKDAVADLDRANAEHPPLRSIVRAADLLAG